MNQPLTAERVYAVLHDSGELLTDYGIAQRIGADLDDVYKALDHLRDTKRVASFWNYGAWFHCPATDTPQQ